MSENGWTGSPGWGGVWVPTFNLIELGIWSVISGNQVIMGGCIKSALLPIFRKVTSVNYIVWFTKHSLAACTMLPG